MNSCNKCEYCDYHENGGDGRCFHKRSQWAGKSVKPDNYCGLFAISGNMSLKDFRKYLVDLSTDGGNKEVMELWNLLLKKQEGMLHELPVPMGADLYKVVRSRTASQRDFVFLRHTKLMQSNYFEVLREFGTAFFADREEAVEKCKAVAEELAGRKGTGGKHK